MRHLRLTAADDVEELKIPPNFGFHRLEGDRAGTCAMTLTRNWRLTFRVTERQSIVDLDLEDSLMAITVSPHFAVHPGEWLRAEIVAPQGTQCDGVGVALRGLPSGDEHTSQRPRRPRRGYGDPLREGVWLERGYASAHADTA